MQRKQRKEYLRHATIIRGALPLCFLRLQKRIALVTGASEGIGAACVNELRSHGAIPVLVARSADKLRRVAQGNELVFAADLRLPEDRHRVVETVLAHHGRLEILVNNAGAGLYGPSHTADLEDARALWELNFFAPLHLSQLCVPALRQQDEAAIVNISSIAGKVTLPWFTLYSASKYALCSLTDGLRMELVDSAVRCMSVCPGYVKTDFQKNVIAGAPPRLQGVRGRWAITPERCARDIVSGLKRNARTVVTPATGWLLIAAARVFPSMVDRQLASAARKMAAK